MTIYESTGGKRRITDFLTRQNESEEAQPSNTGKIAKVTPSQTSGDRKPNLIWQCIKGPKDKKTN